MKIKLQMVKNNNESIKPKIFLYGAGAQGWFNYYKLKYFDDHFDEIIFVETDKKFDEIEDIKNNIYVPVISKDEMLNTISKNDVLIITINRPISEDVFDVLSKEKALEYHVKNKKMLIYDYLEKPEIANKYLNYNFIEYNYTYLSEKNYIYIINSTKNSNNEAIERTFVSLINLKNKNDSNKIYIVCNENDNIKKIWNTLANDTNMKIVFIETDKKIINQKELYKEFLNYKEDNISKKSDSYLILLSCGDELVSNALSYINNAIDSNIEEKMFLSDRDIFFENEYLSPFYRSKVEKESVIKKNLYKDLLILQDDNIELDKLDNAVVIASVLCHVDYNNIDKSNLKTIAYYLPQFHTFPENDKWWGEGFTEWTNTKKAKPLFEGHYQPREPHDDIGYYNLMEDKEIQHKQADMAKQYGLHGFCYYYYWFAEKELMEQPMYKMLNDKSIDLHFCIMWANESWTRSWDGNSGEILIEQIYNDDMLVRFIEKVIPILKDDRYIKIDNEPLLMIYKPDEIPNFSDLVLKWKEISIANGLKGLKVCPVYRNYTNPNKYGCDVTTEFSFQWIVIEGERKKVNKNKISSLDIKQIDYVNFSFYSRRRYDYIDGYIYPSCCIDFDNTARKNDRASIYSNVNLLDYRNNLLYAVDYTITHNNVDEEIVSIFAWNEWAEGAYLEPDKKMGYELLKTTSNVIKNKYDI